MTDPVDISCPEIAIVSIEKRSAAIGISGGRWSWRARGREEEGMKSAPGQFSLEQWEVKSTLSLRQGSDPYRCLAEEWAREDCKGVNDLMQILG